MCVSIVAISTILDLEKGPYFQKENSSEKGEILLRVFLLTRHALA